MEIALGKTSSAMINIKKIERQRLRGWQEAHVYEEFLRNRRQCWKAFSLYVTKDERASFHGVLSVSLFLSRIELSLPKEGERFCGLAVGEEGAMWNGG